MVSGFFTSPWDHSRIFSGDASEIRIALNESGSFGFSKKLKMSFTWVSPQNFSQEDGKTGSPEKGFSPSDLLAFPSSCSFPLRWRPGLCCNLACHLLQGRLVLAWCRWILDQLHVQAERLQLFEQ